jgi:hypothetical protein
MDTRRSYGGDGFNSETRRLGDSVAERTRNFVPLRYQPLVDEIKSSRSERREGAQRRQHSVPVFSASSIQFCVSFRESNCATAGL